MIKPFSEEITTGSIYPTETYAEVSISMKHLLRGNNLDEKIKIFFNRAGIVKGPRKEWLEYKIKTEWKDEKYLQHQSPKSKEYNDKLLDFLVSQDYEYQFSQAMKGNEPLPKEVQEYLKTQINELVKKPVKKRGGTITPVKILLDTKMVKDKEGKMRPHPIEEGPPREIITTFPSNLVRALETHEKNLQSGQEDLHSAVKEKVISKIVQKKVDYHKKISELMEAMDDIVEYANKNDIPYPPGLTELKKYKKQLTESHVPGTSKAEVTEQLIQEAVRQFRDFLIETHVRIGEMNLSRREQEKIYASPGVVPTWWWSKPEKGTYTYNAIKAIKKLKVSARDVKLAIEKAAAGKKLSPQDAQIIGIGWGVLSKEGRKILSGQFPIKKGMFRQYGEFYHRDVGWYS